MKKILLLSALLLVSSLNFNCGDKTKMSVNQKPDTTKTEVSDLQKAQNILNRAKNLLLNFPAEKDIYGAKDVFDYSTVTTCTYDGTWNFSLDGQPYLIFLVPTQSDFDKGCPNMPVVMVTKSGKISDTEFPFVVINPRWLQIINAEVDLDYLASCMIHEAIHCWRFMGTVSNKLKPISSTEREKEAYLFQFQFIPIILERNGIGGAKAPAERLRINSHQDMLNAAAVVDQSNGGKLGMLSNLVFQKAYLKECLPFLTLPDPGK